MGNFPKGTSKKCSSFALFFSSQTQRVRTFRIQIVQSGNSEPSRFCFLAAQVPFTLCKGLILILSFSIFTLLLSFFRLLLFQFKLHRFSPDISSFSHSAEAGHLLQIPAPQDKDFCGFVLSLILLFCIFTSSNFSSFY